MVPDPAKTLVEQVVLVFEALGIGVIVIGFAAALVSAGRLLLGGCGGGGVYDRVRSVFGRSVLLGLEILVAADIIRTVAVDLTMENLLVLGLLVLIRTFLSWSLEVELEGMWPWQRHQPRSQPESGAGRPEV
jgi:uncharacterized membrane protein